MKKIIIIGNPSDHHWALAAAMSKDDITYDLPKSFHQLQNFYYYITGGKELSTLNLK